MFGHCRASQEQLIATVPAPADLTARQQEALRLATKPTKSFVAFARALYAAHSEDRTFLHRVERDAGIKRRALFYLLNVGEFLHGYSVSETDAERIGWTKLQIVARHTAKRPGETSQEENEANLRLAMECTAIELPAVLEGRDMPSKGSARSLLIRLPADQYVYVEAALLSYGAEERGRGLALKEVALVNMVRALETPIDPKRP